MPLDWRQPDRPTSETASTRRPNRRKIGKKHNTFLLGSIPNWKDLNERLNECHSDAFAKIDWGCESELTEFRSNVG